jgi:hypothetical protein
MTRTLILILLLVSCKKVDTTAVSETNPEAVRPASQFRIRLIDFKNFAYPYKESEPFEKWEQLDQTQMVQLKNGRHDFPGGEYLLLTSTTYGDLDRDGADEAAVDLRYGTGGTQNWHYLYVFKENGETPKLLSRFVSGSRAYGGLTKTDIRSNTLLLDLQDSARATADCCSQGFIRVTYQLKNGAFEEIPPRIKDSFRIRTYPIYAESPDSVARSAESNIVYVDASGAKHTLTTSRNDSAPSLSFDKKAVVFVRNKKEVWVVQAEGVNERKVFSCSESKEPWVCDTPQFAPESKTIYVIREVEGEKGGVWKIDLETGQAKPLIPDSAQFLVIARGPHTGSILANQRTMSRDAPGEDYAKYPFFLFTPEGTKVREVAEDDAYIFDLAESLEQIR